MVSLSGIIVKRVLLGLVTVIVLYAFPNALSPVIKVVAQNLACLVVGVVIVEAVFVYPGPGQLLMDSVAKRDIFNRGSESDRRLVFAHRQRS